jgi:SAM-dependent methyltransferase
MLFTRTAAHWPKEPIQLTQEQARVNDDWQAYWFSINGNKFSKIIDFGHQYVASHAPRSFLRTLEVGAGLGDQLKYERLTPEQLSNFVALELRENMAHVLQREWPGTRTVIADCQGELPFEDQSFERILAIHLLEHLPNLPAFLRNVRRLLAPGGFLQVVIPCEGGLGYSIGRAITSKRLFERRYRMDYSPIIKSEHVNTALEVLGELNREFVVRDREFYPLRVPLVDVNLCVGLTLTSKP